MTSTWGDYVAKPGAVSDQGLFACDVKVRSPVKVHLHDHSGHFFTAQLSRFLGHAGHQVDHGYSSQFESPHGRLEPLPDDPPDFRIAALAAKRPFEKYSPIKRTRYELSYARSWQRYLEEHPVDVVVACGLPLFTLARMRRYFARTGQPWLLWHQDVYSRAIGDEAARTLPSPITAVVRRALRRLERSQVRDADAVVAIDAAFLAEYQRWGLSTDHVHVLPNWAPTNEITPSPRNNPWGEAHGIVDGRLHLMYAGTIGRKHNPTLLVDLLDAVKEHGIDAFLTVVSEGEALDSLAAATTERPDVTTLAFQTPDDISNMLASADFCVALLEPAAAQFSVPSKVLSYLCAGRPTIALVPPDNAAAIEVRETGGFAAAPTPDGVGTAAAWTVGVWRDKKELARLGATARDHAVQRYDIDRIGAEFASLILTIARNRQQPTGPHAQRYSGGLEKRAASRSDGDDL